MSTTLISMSRATLRTATAAMLLALGPTLIAAGCAPSRGEGAAEARQSAPADPERGRYLVTVGGCGDCHTPLTMTAEGPVPDLERLLSGHPQELTMPPAPTLGDSPWVWVGSGSNTAFAGPWGVSFAINLTPDENTGIGVWTEEMFLTTLRTGRHWGVARPILPPMPWQNYAQMDDQDLRDVFAYLRTVPPIHNRVPEAVLPATPAAAGS